MGTLHRAAWVILVAGMTGPGMRAGDSPTAKELETLWTDLGTDDPVRADRAIAALVAKPARAVPSP